MIALGEEVSNAQLLKASNDFVNSQLRHIKIEQNSLFPVAQNILDREDWASITEKVAAINSSTSEEDLKLEEYAHIVDGIMSRHPSTLH